MPWLTTATLTRLGLKRPTFYIPQTNNTYVTGFVDGFGSAANVDAILQPAARALSWSQTKPLILIGAPNISSISDLGQNNGRYFKPSTEAHTFNDWPTTAQINGTRGTGGLNIASGERGLYAAGPLAANLPAPVTEEEETEPVETPVVVEPPGNEDGQGSGGMLASPLPRPGAFNPIIIGAFLPAIVEGISNLINQGVEAYQNYAAGQPGSLPIVYGGNDMTSRPPGFYGPLTAGGDYYTQGANADLEVITLANGSGTVDGGDYVPPVIGLASVGAAAPALYPVARAIVQGGTYIGTIGASATGAAAGFIGRPVYRVLGGSTGYLWGLLPSPIQTLIAAVTGYVAAEAIDYAIDFPGFGNDAGRTAIEGGSWNPSVGDNVGIGVGGAFVTKTWVANATPFVALSDGRLGARKKTGAWRFWRPRKPVAVVYSDGVSNLRALTKGSAALKKQSRQLKKAVKDFEPNTRRSRKQPEIVEGTVVRRRPTTDISNIDVR